MTKSRNSRTIRANLGHPVVDSDGHWREFEPIAMRYLKEIGGPGMVEAWGKKVRRFGEGAYGKMSQQERWDKRHGRPPWWTLPVRNTVDVATSFIPKLMHQRLPDMGLDFAVLYPTGPQLFAPYLSDDELRLAAVRAFNTYAAEAWAEFSDRCTPVGVIPMHTPQEAVAELEHCKKLGLKAVALGSLIRRPIPALEAKGVGRRYSCYLDVLGLDSPYDYDPVWQKCQELGYAATFHSASEGYGLRNSLSNFVYNHIGHFAEAGSAVCKALFLGGVTRRFPQMRFAFLEGGVGWACSLFSDLIGHWEKRNGKVIQDFNPANLDQARLFEYLKEYGGEEYYGLRDEFRRTLGVTHIYTPQELDDFATAKIENKRDLRDLFVPRFYFGCEADDSTTSYAFASQYNPFGAKLGAVLASDISHFDVPDMTEVLEEAWELVEEKGMTKEDFHAFSFGNAVDLWSALNPDFFKGTSVEQEARKHRESKAA